MKRAARHFDPTYRAQNAVPESPSGPPLTTHVRGRVYLGFVCPFGTAVATR